MVSILFRTDSYVNRTRCRNYGGSVEFYSRFRCCWIFLRGNIGRMCTFIWVCFPQILLALHESFSYLIFSWTLPYKIFRVKMDFLWHTVDFWRFYRKNYRKTFCFSKSLSVAIFITVHGLTSFCNRLLTTLKEPGKLFFGFMGFHRRSWSFQINFSTRKKFGNYPGVLLSICFISPHESLLDLNFTAVSLSESGIF